MSTLPLFVLEDFVNSFYRAMNYIAPYSSSITYNTGDIVEYAKKKYTKINEVQSIPTNSSNWSLVARAENDVFLYDIEKAQKQASATFHINFFSIASVETQALAYQYLVMHYVGYDAQNTDLYAFENSGTISSVSISGTGGVSESYQNFDWAMRDPLLANLVKSGYGNKYLALLEHYRINNIVLIDNTSQKPIIN
jgi:hypothetical protein